MREGVGCGVGGITTVSLINGGVADGGLTPGGEGTNGGPTRPGTGATGGLTSGGLGLTRGGGDGTGGIGVYGAVGVYGVTAPSGDIVFIGLFVNNPAFSNSSNFTPILSASFS